MIVYDLLCRDGGHRFEGWFGSSGDFARQQESGLLACPQCGSVDVGKAPMAPAVGRKGNQVSALPDVRPAAAAAPGPAPGTPGGGTAVRTGSLPPEAMKVMQALAQMQAEALKHSRWVGDSFAEDARAMHYGEREAEVIHGQATPEEAQDLLEEGIELAPLPFPVAPPGKAN